MRKIGYGRDKRKEIIIRMKGKKGRTSGREGRERGGKPRNNLANVRQEREGCARKERGLENKLASRVASHLLHAQGGCGVDGQR